MAVPSAPAKLVVRRLYLAIDETNVRPLPPPSLFYYEVEIMPAALTYTTAYTKTEGARIACWKKWEVQVMASPFLVISVHVAPLSVLT